MVQKFLAYSIVMAGIFISLFFIVAKNRDYQNIAELQGKISHRIQEELVNYNENLFQIEQQKAAHAFTKSEGQERIGSILLDDHEYGIDDIKQNLEEDSK